MPKRTLMALIDTHLVLKLSELPTAIIEELKAMFTRTNPVFFKKGIANIPAQCLNEGKCHTSAND